jgi:hypothetical protein
MPRSTAPAEPPASAQSLGAPLKSARDIMRSDRRLNGDLDDLPMLTCRRSRREEAHSETPEVRGAQRETGDTLVTSAAKNSRTACE